MAKVGHHFAWGGDAAGDPVRERSRQLFAYVTASEARRPASAALLADAIEDTLVAPAAVGAAIGCEADLTRRFAVGRRLARQASRVLQERGVLRAQRGVGGGLIVCDPDLEETADALAEAMFARSPHHGVEDARRLLRPLLAETAAPLSGLLAAVLARADGAASPAVTGRAPAGAASRLAERIVADFGLGLDRADRAFIGSLDRLAERYDVTRETAIQAVRLLEDRESIRLVRGRAGGIEAGQAGHARVARRVQAYLFRRGASMEACDTLLRAINVRLIDLACERADEAQRDALADVLHAMTEQSAASEVGLSWFLLQRGISDAADSPALHLLARCLSGFLLLTRLRTAELPEAHARELIAASRAIVRNIRLRHADASRQPHDRCQTALKGKW